jgi:hypothetical protein
MGASVTAVIRHLHKVDSLVTPETIQWVCAKHGVEPKLQTVKDLLGEVKRKVYDKKPLLVSEEACVRLEATMGKAPKGLKVLTPIVPQAVKQVVKQVAPVQAAPAAAKAKVSS